MGRCNLSLRCRNSAQPNKIDRSEGTVPSITETNNPDGSLATVTLTTDEGQNDTTEIEFFTSMDGCPVSETEWEPPAWIAARENGVAQTPVVDDPQTDAQPARLGRRFAAWVRRTSIRGKTAARKLLQTN